jgi:predicted transcriptional regulator
MAAYCKRPESASMLIEAPISLGELIDKITILEIKAVNIQDPTKLKNVTHELNVLNTKVDSLLDAAGKAKLAPLQQALKDINQELWIIEDDIRDCEFAKDFSDKFIQLARAVYVTNDKRAKVKKDINLAFGSELIEEKSYKDYQ